ncbi:ion transporter [Spirosoma sp. KCTC 42546]|uniref:ion transporter n=1 Tax=Spirosoma sp. KCTC 42546 TaxID=2520506 RepID=UPI00115BDCC7|nr:ion transporter [Spirosoma sp. KCTC 42546]QDK80494.1 ion transporter [Spirosoma sp. KCTC 42546]
MNSLWQRFRHRLHEIVFEADTWAGRAFDISLLFLIVLSVLAVVLESVPSLARPYGHFFDKIEWLFTILFTIEYILRIISIRKPLRYITSFFGLVDLLAILPSYLGLFLFGAHELAAVRILRLLRIFRILKLGEYTSAAALLAYSLRESRAKITVFFVAIFTLVITLGAMMYVVEGRSNGFESIPLSIYWAVITITTVGYGDIVPSTPMGKLIATLIMLLGYVIIAVPTGIVAVSLTAASKKKEISTQACPNCGRQGHDPDAVHCKYCGAAL